MVSTPLKHISQNGFTFANFWGENHKNIWVATTQILMQQGFGIASTQLQQCSGMLTCLGMQSRPSLRSASWGSTAQRALGETIQELCKLFASVLFLNDLGYLSRLSMSDQTTFCSSTTDGVCDSLSSAHVGIGCPSCFPHEFCYNY